MCKDGFYLRAKLGVVDINCLIDTGANSSILHPRKYYAIPNALRPPLQQLENRIRLADGGTISPFGCVTLPITIPEVGTVYQSVIVAETEEPLVFGNDFLTATNCVIDVANHSLQIAGKVIECCLESKLPYLFRIRLSEDITVPANSEMILPGYITADPDIDIPENLLIEPSEKVTREGILLARTLVKTDISVVPVRVMNPLAEPTKLYKKTILGKCSSINEVSALQTFDQNRQFSSDNVKMDGKTSTKTLGRDVKVSASCSNSPEDLPEHLKPVWDQCKDNLKTEQQEAVKDLLRRYADIFATDKWTEGEHSWLNIK